MILAYTIYQILVIVILTNLNDIQKELQTNVSLQSNVAGKAYVLQIAGRKQIERILNYLYNNSKENNRLNRKYQKYLDCLDRAHRH